MDALHLREILLKARRDIKCPACHSELSIHDIELLSGSNPDEECVLHMRCQHCHFSFGGKAKLVENQIPESKKFNASSLIKSVRKKSETISEEEKALLHQQLRAGIFPW